uniref:C2h2-type zn-finger protein n=1 Tax=Culex tarsalis TaxID=7177 RepID=A0A1Q3F1Q7_CULTA
MDSATISISCCRICLAAEKTLLSLQTEIEVDGCKLTCLEMFTCFTGLKEPSEETALDLPRKICIACFSELNSCYKFQRKAIDSFHSLYKKANSLPSDVSEEEGAREDIAKQDSAPEIEEELEIFVELQDDNLKVESTSLELIDQPQQEEKEPIDTDLLHSVEECEEEFLEVYECDDKGLVELKGNVGEIEEPSPVQNVEEVVAIEINLENRQELETQLLDEPSQQIFEGSLTCAICSKQFASRKTLRQHVRIHEDRDSKRFRCSHCSKTFNYSHHLKIHERMHTREKPFACGACDKQFATKDRLKNHELQHKDRFEHGCALCECSFRTKKALKMHTILKHDAAVEKFEPIVCAKCGKDLFSQSAASAHFKGACGQRQRSAAVEHPGRKSKQKQQKPVDCIDCLKQFPSRAELLEHRVEVHENRSHTCEICGKRFLQAIVLSRHMKTHTGEKSYSCDQCPKSFVQLATLQNHMRSHSDSQQFQCVVCSKRYKFLASLRNHVRASHGEEEA